MTRQISGIIKLDGVPLQTQVRVTDAATGELIATTNSNTTGRYGVEGLDNKPMYVQAVPPAGRRPLMHGPIVPYLPPTLIQPRGAVQFEQYSSTLTVIEGDITLLPPFQWSIASGSLPTGLHLGLSTTESNTITGVPIPAVGTYSVTIRVEDAQGVVIESPLDFKVGEVVSLLHFDGDLTDEKGGAWSYYLAGTIDTTDPIFGTGSLSNSGKGGAIGPIERIDKNNSWTIEGFVYCTNRVGFNVIYTSRFNGADKNSMQLVFTDTSPLGIIVFGSNGVSQSFASTAPLMPLNVVTHVAVTYDKPTNTLRIFQAGQKVHEGSVNVTWNATHRRGLATWLGADWPTRYLRGSLDEWRETVGVARYTENFTPPLVPFSIPNSTIDLAINGSLPSATANAAYISTNNIKIHGIYPPFSVNTSGDFPAGWQAVINGDFVEISGAGVAAGDYTFTLNVSDNNSNTVHLPLFLRVNP